MVISIKVGDGMFPCGKNTEAGSVLVLVLIGLLMVTLYGVNSLEIGLLESKMSQHYWLALKREYFAEKALKNTEKQLQTSVSCQVSWDKNNGYFKTSKIPDCHSHTNGFVIHQAVERLPAPDCVGFILFNNNMGGLLEPIWYRVTVFLQDPSARQPVILQSVVTLPSQQVLRCQENVRYVDLGRQSWRKANKY